MKTFTSPLKNLSEFEDIRRELMYHQGVLQVSGCIDSQKSHFMYSAGDGFQKKIILTYSDLKAKEIYEDYKFFDPNVMLYPSKDLIFYSADIHSNLIGQQRIAVMKALLENDRVTVITTLAGCMDHLLPLQYFAEHVLCLKNDSSMDLDRLSEELVGMGYEKSSQVEGFGQFAVRGGILDIYPLTEENPIRIELWGDEMIPSAALIRRASGRWSSWKRWCCTRPRRLC